MSDGSDLFDEEPISAPVEETDVAAEAQSAPDDLSGLDSPVDQGSQTQPSDAVPTQNEYQEPQAPQIDPQWIGAAYTLGIQNPEQYAPEQLAFEIRRRNHEVQQQIQFARHAQSDWSAYEAWKREQAAGAQGRAPVAAAPEPEEFDPDEYIKKAWPVPDPPAYLQNLRPYLTDRADGLFTVKPEHAHLVPSEVLAEVNAWAKVKSEHEAKLLKNPVGFLKESFGPILKHEIQAGLQTIRDEQAAAQQQYAKAQYVQQFASQVGQYAQDQYGNPTPYGQTLMQNLMPFKDKGFDPQEVLQIAHERTVGQLAMQHARQQQLAAYYAHQYGQPPQTQTYNQPQQFDRQPTAPQAPAPQPHAPDFLSVASHAANGSPFGDGDKDDWQPKHLGELKAKTFDQAARQLAGR